MGWFGDTMKEFLTAPLEIDIPQKKIINITNNYFITINNKIIKVSRGQFINHIKKHNLKYDTEMLEDLSEEFE